LPDFLDDQIEGSVRFQHPIPEAVRLAMRVFSFVVGDSTPEFSQSCGQEQESHFLFVIPSRFDENRCWQWVFRSGLAGDGSGFFSTAAFCQLDEGHDVAVGLAAEAVEVLVVGVQVDRQRGIGVSVQRTDADMAQG